MRRHGSFAADSALVGSDGRILLTPTPTDAAAYGQVVTPTLRPATSSFKRERSIPVMDHHSDRTTGTGPTPATTRGQHTGTRRLSLRALSALRTAAEVLFALCLMVAVGVRANLVSLFYLLVFCYGVVHSFQSRLVTLVTLGVALLACVCHGAVMGAFKNEDEYEGADVVALVGFVPMHTSKDYLLTFGVDIMVLVCSAVHYWYVLRRLNTRSREQQEEERTRQHFDLFEMGEQIMNRNEPKRDRRQSMLKAVEFLSSVFLFLTSVSVPAFASGALYLVLLTRLIGYTVFVHKVNVQDLVTRHHGGQSPNYFLGPTVTRVLLGLCLVIIVAWYAFHLNQVTSGDTVQTIGHYVGFVNFSEAGVKWEYYFFAAFLFLLFVSCAKLHNLHAEAKEANARPRGSYASGLPLEANTAVDLGAVNADVAQSLLNPLDQRNRAQTTDLKDLLAKQSIVVRAFARDGGLLLGSAAAIIWCVSYPSYLSAPFLALAFVTIALFGLLSSSIFMWLLIAYGMGLALVEYTCNLTIGFIPGDYTTYGLRVFDYPFLDLGVHTLCLVFIFLAIRTQWRYQDILRESRRRRNTAIPAAAGDSNDGVDGGRTSYTKFAKLTRLRNQLQLGWKAVARLWLVDAKRVIFTHLDALVLATILIAAYLEDNFFTSSFISAQDFGLEYHASTDGISNVFVYLLPTAVMTALCFWQLSSMMKEIVPYDLFIAGRSRAVDVFRFAMETVQHLLISFSATALVIVTMWVALDEISFVGWLYVVVLIAGRAMSESWKQLWFPLFWLAALAMVLKYLIQLSTFDTQRASSVNGNVLFKAGDDSDWVGTIRLGERYDTTRMAQYFDSSSTAGRQAELDELTARFEEHYALYASKNSDSYHPTSSCEVDDDDDDLKDRARAFTYDETDIPALRPKDNEGASDNEPESDRTEQSAGPAAAPQDRDFLSCLRDFGTTYASKASVNVVMLLLTISCFVHQDFIAIVYMMIVYSVMYAASTTVCKRWWALAWLLSLCEILMAPAYETVFAVIVSEQNRASHRREEIVRDYYRLRTEQWYAMKKEKNAAIQRLKIIVSKLVHKVEELMDIALGLHHNLPPMAPSKPVSVERTQNSATISWDKPTGSRHRIRYYRISRQQFPSLTLLGDFADIVEITGDRCEAKIEGLRPGTSYQFKVCAVSRMGEGPFSVASEPISTFPLNLDGSMTAGWMKYRRERLPAPRFGFLISWLKSKYLHRYVVIDSSHLVFYQDEEKALRHRSRKHRKRLKTSFKWRDVISLKLSDSKVQFDDMSPSLYCFEIVVRHAGNRGDVKYVFQSELSKEFNTFLSALAFAVPREALDDSIVECLKERGLPNPLDVAPPSCNNGDEDPNYDENKSEWSSVTGDESTLGDPEDEEFDDKKEFSWRAPLYQFLYKIQNAGFRMESTLYEEDDMNEPSLAEIGQLIINAVRSKSSSICCLVLVICFTMQGDMLNMVYVLAVFGFLIVENPRPSPIVWTHLLAYTCCIIALRAGNENVVSKQVDMDADESEVGFHARAKESWLEKKLPKAHAYFQTVICKPPSQWDKDIHVAITGEKPGRDFYTASLSVLLFSAIYAVIFYEKLGEADSSSTSVADANSRVSSSSLLSGYLVLLVLIELIFIIWDRVAYVCASLQSKVILQYSYALTLHMTVWYFLPNYTNIYFHQRPALVAFYLFQCVYLWLGALQIRYGYPAYLGSRYNYTEETKMTAVSEMLFGLMMQAPFLFEMRALLDYMCTKTSLSWQHWILLEDTAAHLFAVKGEMHGRVEEADVLQGKKRQPMMKKLTSAGVMLLFLLICLVGPLAMFSSINPSTTSNDVTLSTVVFGIVDEQATMNQLYSNSDSNSPSCKVDLNTESASVQCVEFDIFSHDVWGLSPPRMDLLVTQLQSTEALNWTMTLSFTRPGPTNNEVISATYSVKMTDDHRNALIPMIKQTANSDGDTKLTAIQIDDLFPAVLQLTASSGVLRRSTEMRSVAVTKHSSGGSSWWTIEPVMHSSSTNYCSAAYPFCIVAVSDRIVQGLTTLGISSYGLTAVYVFVVVTVGSAVKGFFRGKLFQIQYAELPDPEDVLELVEGIYIARQEHYVGHLKDEVRIFETFVRVLRSPETLIKVTGTNVIHIPAAKEKLD
ncbi:hypothetical protein PHYBOEH_004769 [Phytophthora boehmeriae]|uniref:Fibronectin type-III domain-containing protein n=1 Tax=Phytophthora boehmeriae TaxID=109152 RepID=A0A8T1X3A6_9STRA|nr:hypothetical protein PHYBOEH_004769 [Phytophthora boehmeriae]